MVLQPLKPIVCTRSLYQVHGLILSIQTFVKPWCQPLGVPEGLVVPTLQAMMKRIKRLESRCGVVSTGRRRDPEDRMDLGLAFATHVGNEAIGRLAVVQADGLRRLGKQIHHRGTAQAKSLPINRAPLLGHLVEQDENITGRLGHLGVEMREVKKPEFLRKGEVLVHRR